MFVKHLLLAFQQIHMDTLSFSLSLLSKRHHTVSFLLAPQTVYALLPLAGIHLYFFDIHKQRHNASLFVHTMAVMHHRPSTENEILRVQYAPHGGCLISGVMCGGGSLLGCSSFAAAHPREV